MLCGTPQVEEPGRRDDHSRSGGKCAVVFGEHQLETIRARFSVEPSVYAEVVLLIDRRPQVVPAIRILCP